MVPITSLKVGDRVQCARRTSADVSSARLQEDCCSVVGWMHSEQKTMDHIELTVITPDGRTITTSGSRNHIAFVHRNESSSSSSSGGGLGTAMYEQLVAGDMLPLAMPSTSASNAVGGIASDNVWGAEGSRFGRVVGVNWTRGAGAYTVLLDDGAALAVDGVVASTQSVLSADRYALPVLGMPLLCFTKFVSMCLSVGGCCG